MDKMYIRMKCLEYACLIIGAIFISLAFTMIGINIGTKRTENATVDYVTQLEQNNGEQEEEKNYYITRCQQLENIIIESRYNC